ncbi:type II toxin-antitoxin system Phd/YefM family antitoxin [Synechococcus sp. CB0205]|uniref:type II toxin-antitoxin system Phd/YefM family antitoxin n=1 Tax=Synechococcus sp. CB0205 TaxID=232363 RepID=UPI0002002074|nr:type II toxin-antitoxin system Phd/YefM family antitoxin [Synechococcus sp. CB0205]
MSAERFGVQEARQRFPELLVRASKGERLVIQRHRQDLAAIVPLQDATAGGPSSQEAMENLLSLKGSAKERSPQQRTPGAAGAKARFQARQLGPGSRIGLDGSALVAFLNDDPQTSRVLQPVLQGIAQGSWQGVISSISLMQVMETALCQGDEALALRYSTAFANPRQWLQVPLDGGLALAASRLKQQEPQLELHHAIELATAIQNEVAVLVTADGDLAQTALHPVLPCRSI